MTRRPDADNGGTAPSPAPVPAVAAKLEAIEQATQAALAYVAGERDAPVRSGDRQAVEEILARFELDQPRGTAEIIETLAALGRAHAVPSTGGRYFGFVTGGTEPTALAASLLATTWDQNAALPVMSPVAAAIDARAAHQIIEVLNLPPSATAAFCGGASVANLTAVITARDALLAAVGWDVATQGLNGSPPIRVVISDEAHISVDKALRLAGFGTRMIQRAPVDGWGRIDPARLPPLDGPTLVVAQAGNVNTGHSDPFEAIFERIPRVRRLSAFVGGRSGEGPVWVHVDGAFGLWAAAAPSLGHQIEGVDRADSWTTDCHKWLNVPYDNGVVIVADGRHLSRAMSVDAAYLNAFDSGRAPMHLGVQMSQAARAIPVWATLAALGRPGVAELVERCCRLAGVMADRLAAAGVEIAAPVVLNQVLARFGDDTTTDAVIVATSRSGESWVGGTTWQGRRAMRISVSDIATTDADIDRAASAVIRAWRRVGTAGETPD
ncbi:MAG: pyridoxal-dependent decarboxylase [Acidimicrobiia bacterium]|nr:pyridoxal-dependent decarboxylase [Acidimicrobiia bacterium]